MRRLPIAECLLMITRSFLRVTFLSVIVFFVSFPSITLNPQLCADDGLDKLRNDQDAVAGRYSRFERLLSQMADMLGREDPERAELLRRAISEGREQAISSELESISKSLGEGELGLAQEKQSRVAKSMQQIIVLLQSEDRRSEVEKERERLNELLKDIRNLTARQKAARAAAQNSRSPSSAAPDQQQTLKKTDQILNDVETHDQKNDESEKEGSDATENNPEGEKQSSNGNGDSEKSSQPKDKSEDNPQGEGSKSEDGQSSQNPDGKQPDESESPSDKESNDPSKKGDTKDPSKDGSKQSDAQSSENANPEDAQQSQESESSGSQQSQQQSGQQPSGQQNQSPQQQKKQQQQTPGREQLEEAKKAMQEAIEQLKKQQRDAALDQQDDAISKLQEAQKKLEETLKQLREEEKEMILAALEARFQRMLSLQTQIYEETVALGSTVRAEWLNAAITRCRELSQEQADLTRECSLTVGLLQEDGTSVSILIAVEDIESDMKTVAGRLQQTQAAELTQSMQTDVIEALKELIETAQKEMEDMKQEQQQQQQQQQQSGPQQKAPLVELMAEIRVLRSLQLRVNRRTAIVDRLLQEDNAAEQAGLLNQLEELTLRQNRLTESAGELARQMERN